MFSSEDMDYSKVNHVLQENIRNSNIFSTRYLWKRKYVGAEICRTFEERRDLSVDKTSDQNIVIELFHKYLVRGRKFSKTVITREGQRMSTNSFALRLVFSRSTDWYIFHSKMRLTLGNVPSSANKKQRPG